MMWELVSAGALGGLARASYGVLKAVGRRETIHLWWFLVTILMAAIIGGVIGTLFDAGKAVSALVGYAGTDILDNLVKSAIPKKIALVKKT